MDTADIAAADVLALARALVLAPEAAEQDAVRRTALSSRAHLAPPIPTAVPLADKHYLELQVFFLHLCGKFAT